MQLDEISGSFVQVGPTAIINESNEDFSKFIMTGRVNDISIDPQNSNILWAATSKGGVWKSDDSGTNWSPLTDFESSLSIGSILVHPLNSNILYAGTGDPNHLEESTCVGILKTMDGGKTWSLIGESHFSGVGFYRIVFIKSADPMESDFLLAATTDGLYRSLDNDSQWEQLTDMIVTDLAVSRTNNDSDTVIYLGIPKASRRVIGLPSLQISSLKEHLEVDSNSTISYITLDICFQSPPYPELTLFSLFTESQGNNYLIISNPRAEILLLKSTGSEKKYNFVRADPSDPAVAYIGGEKLWQIKRKMGAEGAWDITEVKSINSKDYNSLVFDPNNLDSVYIGTNNGIYSSNNRGEGWSDKINAGLCISDIVSIDQFPDSAFMLAETSHNGAIQYRNSPIFYLSADSFGGKSIVDPRDSSNIVRIFTHNSLSDIQAERSVSGGNYNTWENVSEGLSGPSFQYPPLAMNPTSAQHVACGTKNTIFLDQYQGTGGWRPYIELPNIGTEQPTCIKYATGESIYVGTDGGKVYHLLFSNNEWIPSLIGNHPTLPSIKISDIAILPGNSNLIIVSMAGKDTGAMWRGELTGSNWYWQEISIVHNSITVPCYSIVIDPIYNQIYYAATTKGIFFKRDGDLDWLPLGNRFPNVPVSSIKVIPIHGSRRRLLRAATRGRGLWETMLDEITSSQFILIRDHIMDSGKISPTLNDVRAAFDVPLQEIRRNEILNRWMCPDIKIDAPDPISQSYQMVIDDVDYVAFEYRLANRTPVKGKINHIYVQIHNRGNTVASDVALKLLWTFAPVSSTGIPILPDLPDDFWQQFPNDTTVHDDSWKTINWKNEIGILQPYANISMLSSNKPEVVNLSWELQSNPIPGENLYLLCIANSHDDQIPDTNKISNVLDLTSKERHAAIKEIKFT